MLGKLLLAVWEIKPRYAGLLPTRSPHLQCSVEVGRRVGFCRLRRFRQYLRHRPFEVALDSPSSNCRFDQLLLRIPCSCRRQSSPSNAIQNSPCRLSWGDGKLASGNSPRNARSDRGKAAFPI